MRGRPRSFDRDMALHRVMEVFWAKGYEGAQLNDLTTAIGVAPPSFYAAFKSKEAAFREALDLYISKVASKPMHALEEAVTAEQGVRAMLKGSIDVSRSAPSGGCLLILGLVNSATENLPARQWLQEARRSTLELIKKRLQRGILEGDLPADADIGSLSVFYFGIMQAISFQGRDGASAGELEALVEPAMAALK